MTETARTAVFAAVAAVAVALAAALSWPGRTPDAAGFDQVGTPFFTAFEANGQPGGRSGDGERSDDESDGNLAKIAGFQITAFEPKTLVIQTFGIDRDEDSGLYGIAPYGYPAEAAEKLAETAAALATVKRTALQSRRAADWEALGVVDPAALGGAPLTGRGLRVELTGDDGKPLADLIIGKPVPRSGRLDDGQDRDGYFYVREPGDNSTYIARLANLNLSAAFPDWIDRNLLGVAAADLRRLSLPAADEPFTLIRDAGNVGGDGGETWAPAAEVAVPAGRQVDQAAADRLTRTAAELSIVGVRPRPEGLEPNLTLPPDPRVRRSVNRLLAAKGFLLDEQPNGSFRLRGAAGELTVTDDAGVAYDLLFGELFTGTTYDFAVGDAGEGLKTLAADDADQPPAAARQGRYLFVTARVDAAAVGPPPSNPPRPGCRAPGCRRD